MAKIIVNNPRQVINGGAKKYYFKVKGLGGPKGDKGDTGATGPQGPQGPQGNAATVSVGSTTTLPVGQDATVQNVGTLYNAVLNFGIPQGPRGPQGATGATGAKGDKGDQGNPGPQGEKGTNATVYVGTTSTLNPGSQATVYNSGTDSNAVLNFGIPKGEKGDTGPMPTIAQSTGQATDQVMSQKATTDAINTKQATITSSNKLSADLVTDTSTTNKFVTAEDKTAWNAKQNALTAGQGIDITSDVISTPALVPEVVASLPAEGAESKLYLTPKAHTSQTASGNPITATITDDAGQLESFQLDGDTLQNGTPTPDYPQQIQTVTGEQTITINGTDYPLDLGDIQLCGLGDDGNGNPLYKDYIYPDGDDWKVHKATATIILSGKSSENWVIDQYAYMLNGVISAKPFSDIANMEAYCNSFSKSATGQVSRYVVSFWYNATGTGVRFIKDQTPDLSSFRNWLASNNQTVYYPLATATDTTITDTNLIAQLEAIRTTSLENGTNTITNSAAGTNLAGDMEIGYYGFNPTNRYDKFIWLDLNNNYEQIGG